MWSYTPVEYVERKALTINPAKTCQPIGAIYAALGIHRCLPHSHGSQGCCSYHRMHLTRHFRDPIMASTSSFTEGASVFGGASNLKTAIKNIFTVYNPDIIAIHTTCLSETIGDDIPTIIGEVEIPDGKYIIHANTPSYVGSHVTGFANMVKGMVNYLSKNTCMDNNKINVIPGFVNPSDMREIKRLLKLMGVDFILFPDTSGVLDTPLTGKYEMFPYGGAKISEIVDSGNSKFTIGLGHFSSSDATRELKRKCAVDGTILKLPIGIRATDEFLWTISKITGKEIPFEIEEERGQVVDVMVDCHHHWAGKEVAIFGDPDTVIPLVEFVISLGMSPKYVVTGTPGDMFEEEVTKMLKEAEINAKVKAAGDLFTLHQWIKQDRVDLLIGNSYGKYISRSEDIPFVRIGFPILDRAAHTYFPVVGYKGALRIIEMISHALLSQKEKKDSDEDFELVL